MRGSIGSPAERASPGSPNDHDARDGTVVDPAAPSRRPPTRWGAGAEESSLAEMRRGLATNREQGIVWFANPPLGPKPLDRLNAERLLGLGGAKVVCVKFSKLIM